MCDYSLHAHPNRLATEGEKLVLTRFPAGSMGFTSQAELECHQSWRRSQATPKFEWSWRGIKAYFQNLSAQRPIGPMMAVCIPPGATLHLEDIPWMVQQVAGVSKDEEVTFTQLGCEAYTYRDAVRFRNGKEILIQRLSENQRATVVSLGGKPEPIDGNGAEIPVGALEYSCL